MKRIVYSLLPLLLLLAAGPVAAQVDYIIIVKDAAWIPAFNPLVNWLNSHGHQAEALYLADGAAARAHIRARQAALQSSGKVLMGMLVEDPSESLRFDLQQIYHPEVAGADLGWGDYVPSWDNYNDFDGDHVPETAVWPLPAQSYADCAAYAAKAVAWHSGATPLGHVARVTVLCEDYDRDGRPGALVREHGLVLKGMWENGVFSPVYQGDDHPYNYFLREADADALDNQGHQFKVTLGTTANKVNMVFFQDQRQTPGWSVAHLEAGRGLYAHFALSCAHLAVDRSDNAAYGRPHVEQVTFAPDRGAFVTYGFTRQGYQYTHYWMGEAMFNNLIPRLTANLPVTAGKVWLEARRDFLAAHPEHVAEAASFYGLGDPSLMFVRPARSVVGVGEVPEFALALSTSPNPFNPMTRIEFSLPEEQEAGLEVYDLQGRHLATLLPSEKRAAGRYSVSWDGRSGDGSQVSSGVYFVRLNTASGGKTLKLTLLK